MFALYINKAFNTQVEVFNHYCPNHFKKTDVPLISKNFSLSCNKGHCANLYLNHKFERKNFPFFLGPDSNCQILAS